LTENRTRRPRASGRVVPASEQPGNSWKYLYQRLSEKQFQQLCSALLRHDSPDVRCFPVGMSDGGKDIEVPSGDGTTVIYQVKWTSKVEQDPVAWFKDAVQGERENIERLVREEKATKYVLMTSVAGTSIPKRGSMPRLQVELAASSKRLGIPMVCLWQADIDAMVDAAPDSIKWNYQEMLAGSELVRFLIHGSQVEGRAAELRETLRSVMATQWLEDAKVKFSQVEMDHINIVDLFVDVEERLEAAPTNALDSFISGQQSRGMGAVKYLLQSTQPLTLIRGVPGQGKSTLGQYLCQIHRAALLGSEPTILGKQPEEVTQDPKIPLRVDLRDYAAWLEGHDPYEVVDEIVSAPGKPRRASAGSLENFLAHYCRHYSGGRSVTVDQVQDVLERYPVIIVLDGLDEVAEPKVRERVVDEIDRIAVRLGTSTRRKFQLVVTTRPNSSGLAEPSPERFETLHLSPLTRDLQTRYLRKWADVNDIRGAKRRELIGVFRDRVAEDHIAQLADNPMQLTILLYLMNRRGESVPTARTPLYTQYMDTLLDREVVKSDIVKDNRRSVEEVTSYLGWHMQSRSEMDAGHGRMPLKKIERALLLYLDEVEGPTDLVKTIFRAVADRFWALSSKVSGTFEFAVQPVREYFAARFLAQYAGLDGPSVLKAEVLHQLVLRPYWLNTARFYAGFTSPNELAGLVDGLEAAQEGGTHPRQVRVAMWSLLADGVFADVIRVQRRAARSLSDDLSVRLLAAPNPDADAFSYLAPGRGGVALAADLVASVDAQPAHPLATERVGLLGRLGHDRTEFELWWQPRLSIAAGTVDETMWLTLGAAYGGAVHVPAATADRLELASPRACRAALAAGANPANDCLPSRAMLQAVLDGHCTDVPTKSTSHAGDLLKAIRPQHFLTIAKEPRGGSVLFDAQVGHYQPTPTDTRNRSTNFKRLSDRDPRYKRVQRYAGLRKGESGSTARWQNTARELASIHGPCWLAADIAIAGAATQHTVTGGNISRGGVPFGPRVDYGVFVEAVRMNRGSHDWWRDRIGGLEDSLSEATWALAIVAVADLHVVAKLVADIDRILDGLDEDRFEALAATSSRLGASGVARRLPTDLLVSLRGASTRTRLVFAHHTATLARPDALDAYTTNQLTEMAQYGDAAWPAVAALTTRMLAAPDPSQLNGLRACGPHALLTIPNAASNPGAAIVSPILKEPGAYPSGWVLAAERWHSKTTIEEPLATLATRDGWVPDL
jgi:hypothetical protein